MGNPSDYPMRKFIDIPFIISMVIAFVFGALMADHDLLLNIEEPKVHQEYIGEVDSVQVCEIPKDHPFDNVPVKYQVMVKGTPWITYLVVFQGDKICRSRKDGSVIIGTCVKEDKK